MSDNSRVRVSIVGVVIVALFSALLARLWFLQMGPEQKLKARAIVRSTRVVQTEMPRGRILDRNANVLVQDRSAWAVTMSRNLTEKRRARVLGQLAELLEVPIETLQSRYDSKRQSPLKPAILAVDVPQPEQLAILEHREDYPGVNVEQLTVREYPRGMLAAQLVGYVGEIPADQLKRLRSAGYEPGDTIGRAGIEAAYEHDLRGKPRRETVEIDPTGRQVGPPVGVQPGTVGNDVWLSVDVNWQQAAEESLAQGLADAHKLKNDNVKNRLEHLSAPAGAVVVLDVRDGSVAAMASLPSYDPTKWIGGISAADFEQLNDPANHFPLVERATQGQYSPGSTFKLVTALALTRFGVRSPGQWITDTGSVKIGRDTFHNAKGAANGSVNLQRAITVSSDVYFYTAGNEFWRRWKAGAPEGLGLEAVAKELGFGEPTGIELGEATGSIPDPEWKRTLANRIWKTDKERRDNGGWYPADDVFLAVGQGGTTVTPLQLADAYATFANGGTLWRPHLGMVVKAGDSVVRQVAPQARRKIALDPSVRQLMLAGFTGAVADGKGTAYEAFRGFPLRQIPVAGKTGTAQVDQKGDTSLFAAFFPADNPQYVVVAVVEEGGFGAQTAAPIVRRVIEAMNGLQAAPVQVNSAGND